MEKRTLEKSLEEMSKAEQVDFSLIQAAKISEMLINAKENINTTEISPEEFERRTNVMTLLLMAFYYIYTPREILEKREEQEKIEANRRKEYIKKQEEQKEEQIKELRKELYETREKNRKLHCALAYQRGKYGSNNN